jgi:hypothetical protein
VTSVHERGPSILARVVRLVDGTCSHDQGFLARDVTAWIASPLHGLTSVIESVRGAEDVTGALIALAPSDLTMVACVPSAHICWAELERRPVGGDPETCLVGASYGAGGEVSRLVWLCAPLVPAWRGDPAPSAPDARPVIERYFADLMRSRFREAAGHFAGDVIYSHPPYRSGTARVLYLGRDALARGFADERGPTPARQVIAGCWQRRDRLFVEGVVEGIPNGGTFISAGQITPEGEIARYVAFYSAQRFAGRPS